MSEICFTQRRQGDAKAQRRKDCSLLCAFAPTWRLCVKLALRRKHRNEEPIAALALWPGSHCFQKLEARARD